MNEIATDRMHLTKDELVAANHILVQQGVLDAFGHVSARLYPESQSFLLSRNLAPESVTSDDLVIHDFDGGTKDNRPLYLERFLHAEIYRMRPDVMAVVHSHSPSIIPFGLGNLRLRPVIHMAGFLPAEGVRTYEISEYVGNASDLLISTPELGVSLASALGDKPVILMRGHGSVVIGESVPEAVFRAIYAEVNAAIQRDALGFGEAIRYLTEGEANAARASVAGQVSRAWNVWLQAVST